MTHTNAEDADTGFPYDHAVPLYGPEFSTDPALLYSRMRERFGPVAPVLLEGGLPAWLLLDHRVVHEVCSNPKMFARDTRRWNVYDRIPEDWSLAPFVMWAPSMMFVEGAEHQRRAGAVGDALDEIDRTELAAVCGRLSDQLIDGFAGRGAADLVTEYADQLPLLVVAHMYGFSRAETPKLVDDVATTLDQNQDKSNEAKQRMLARMQKLVLDKQSRPGPDMPSRMLAHPAGLTIEEIVTDLTVVLAAIQQPCSNWIGNTLRLMLVDDDFSLTLQGGRSSADHALNQVLWEDTPTQNYMGRFPVHDCVLAGQRVREGDMLILGLAAANNDPRLRAARESASGANRAHMSFGHGEYGCPFPAPELAEVICKAAVEVLLDRLPDVHITVEPADLTWHTSVWMRGLHELPVQFTPTRHTTN